MKIKDFYELVELCTEPEAFLLPNLQYRIKKYPYFQADIFIYIKCLYLSSSEDFADELTRLAPFISDRKALFYYVMNDQYMQFQKKAEKLISSNRMDMLINAFFETLDENEPDSFLNESLNNTNLASLDYFSYLDSLGEDSNQDINIDLETEISVSTTHYNTYTIDADELETEDESEQELLEFEMDNSEEFDGYDIPTLKHQDVIDRFIEKAASEESLRIQIDLTEETLSEDELDNIEIQSTEEELENDYFFTQTLANIYIKQKKYTRAYEIIKHLSLNYPEKNIYFADQLSFLEKLIRNTNTNK